MAEVRLSNIRKLYGKIEIIPSLDLDIDDGEFVVLVGPSGCGKSTLLRMIAGLEPINSGDLMIAGARVNDLSPKERNIAMVFQNYALYPHMTVRENMAFSLRLAKADKATIDGHIGRASEILGLAPLLERLPRQLSGGQRQRVAMGRAIVRDPSVFLFDEPLSNLDAKLRVQMRTEIRSLHDRLKVTTIYVTHDQIEAMTMADKIVVLREGCVEQAGRPMDLYSRPANLFVATFLGSPEMNLLPATRDAAEFDLGEDGKLSGGADFGETGPRDITVGVRPHDIMLKPADQAKLKATVAVVERTGAETVVTCTLPSGRHVCAAMPGQVAVNAGEQVGLGFNPLQLHYFDTGSGKALAA
ncbi:MAG: sn-glycerol-3-phosphate ABC transporter ATP-binding protein UgpC [Hyphomicrobiales bacterium]|nr:sn-glycerol-3-phosphate ABC transporter ATP-binding protein UgpC [Hyphomicrobiales bacterium]